MLEQIKNGRVPSITYLSPCVKNKDSKEILEILETRFKDYKFVQTLCFRNDYPIYSNTYTIDLELE